MTRTVALNTGTEFPLIGLGVMMIPDADTPAAMRTAAEMGYRGFDTAPVYRNEAAVGRGVRECGLPRDEVFVTTKLWNSNQGYDAALVACEASLERLGLDHIDLYLIHWPVPERDLYCDTWRALVRLRDDGRVKAIGVSNFQEQHLQRIVDATGVVPAVNQIELHPRFQQRALLEVHQRLGIVTQAWSPLGHGALLADARVQAIADRFGVSPARLVLAWITGQGIVAIPKASSPEHMRDNLASLELRLDEEAITAIRALDDPEGRGGPDPATFALMDATHA
ncbi:MAG: aldo/keto reductase [Sphingomonadaceae bacterium]|nr:aldo/keto reductase [Sphingomonadaceae bacterium]